MATHAARIRQLEIENAALRKALGEYVPRERLTTAERDLRSILDHLPAMIGYWDCNQRNRFGNRAYLNWFGIDPRNMPGKHIREVIGTERYQLNLPYIEAALRGEAQEFERAIPTPDGKHIRHSLANYIPDCVDGTVRGFYVLVTDITAIKEVEAALNEAHELLERRVSERTEQLRRLAVETTLVEERERQAIARDLHDELGQILYVIRIRLESLENHLSASAIGEVRQLNDLLDDASRQVRSLTAQLCPPVLKRLGLAAALRWLADEMNRQYGLMVSFTNETPSLPLPLPLSPAQSDILFRAARELLINVTKHANTQQARLTLTWRNGELSLTVADDGIGIADAAALAERPEGFGLFSIRERIAYLGGTTTLAPGPAGGLCIALHLPLPQPPATPETP